MAVILETSLGNLTVDLFTDERPICSKNFLKLCKVKYYNFCLFHSVQRNLVAQTGDPTGTGKGGQSIYGQIYGEQAKYFEMEVSPRIKHTKAGLVSMVNNGNNMHGSQFFITLGENLDYLDGKHTVIGEVSEGMDILMQINEAYCDDEHRPYKDIRIYHTIVLDDPYDDPDGLEVPDRSPEPTKEQLATVRIGADEEIDDFKGMSEEQVTEIMEDKEAKANAQILEMIGDIPDADIKPPDNVLFVCKLNPVTTDEDLEIIFSRFGKITSCEVIKDHKSGESLQYAFIEFEKEEDCEKAYFKMDNVLIDDRRIHVDFSQSVSKVKWKGKGKGVIHMQEEEAKPKYRIKDMSRRKDDNYELVFDEEEDSQKSKKSKKKKKKHKYSDSDSEEERGSKSHSKYEKESKRKGRERSRSQSPKRKSNRRSRSRSPEYRKRRSRSPEYRKKKERSRSPYDSYRDRHSNRDSYSDKKSHKDKYRERSRSPSEKHHHSDRKSHKDKYRERDRR